MSYRDMCEKIYEENIKLKERLEDADKLAIFYGNPNNYNYQHITSDDISEVNGSLEAGKTAREYLKKYGVENGEEN